MSSLSSEFYKKIQGLALSSVYEGDLLYFQRKVCRWYSEKYHTPLHQVFDIPWEFVLTCYYEDSFEKMKEEDLEYEVKSTFANEVLQTEEEENQAFALELERKLKERQKAKNNKSESLDKQDQKEISLTFDNLEEP
jgi:primosomal protein N'